MERQDAPGPRINTTGPCTSWGTSSRRCQRYFCPRHDNPRQGDFYEQGGSYIHTSRPGPHEEFEYRGSALRVVGVEQFDALVVVKWVINPEPNVSDVFPEESAALEQDLQDLDDGPADILRKTAERLLRIRRLYVFALADDLGTCYELTEEQHGASYVSNGITRQFIGIMGSVTFHPSVPLNPRSLNFKWFDLTLEVPLAWSPDPIFRPR